MAFEPRERPDVELVAGAVVSYMTSERLTMSTPEYLPDFAHCSVDVLDDKRYAVLRNAQAQPLAVFRIQNSGQLRRMRRPPHELRGVDSSRT